MLGWYACLCTHVTHTGSEGTGGSGGRSSVELNGAAAVAAAARATELSTFPIGQKSVAGPRDSELEALYETESPASRFANKEQ